MSQFNKRFSLIALTLCFGLVAGANAAPSVRVLGASSGSSAGKTAGGTTGTATGAKAKAAKTGNNIKANVLKANTGVKKSASVKTMAPTVASMQPVSRAASARTVGATAGVVTTTAETGAAESGANRFPGIASKTNIQKSYAPSATGSITSADPSAGGYNMQEMSDSINSLKDGVEGKADKTDLDNYYTKDEINAINAGYYTATQVDDKINSIDTSMSSPYIQSLAETIDNHTTEIRNIKGEAQYLYDYTSGEKKAIYLVADFDENAVFGTGN